MPCNDLVINANNPYIRKDGTIPFAANQSLGGNKFTNVGDATESTDLVNYGQLLNAITNITAIGHNFVCGVNIPAFTAVYIKTDGKIYAANSSDVNQMNKVIGITSTDGLSCDDIKIIQYGIIQGMTGLLPGKYYFFDTTGKLTYNPPSTGYTQIVGVALTPTIFQVGLQVPISL
jgi:hypothetical protein